MEDKQTKISVRQWLNIIVLVGGFLPLALLILEALRGTLGFNPVETALHRTGHLAIIFLLLSLTCTPINKIFKLPMVSRLRKPLGLFAALYALLHFAVFAVWDYRLNISLIWIEIIEKPFIWVGFAALVILAVLAVTSYRFWRRKLGKLWVWLHRLAYLAGILAVLHYLLAVRGDLLRLQGDYTWPLLAAGVLIFLFILRLPDVYHFLNRLFRRD